MEPTPRSAPHGRFRLAPQESPGVAIPPGKFHVTTRRGKQFHSMVYGAKDPLTGILRDAVLMSEEDDAELSVKTGDRVKLKSDAGEYLVHVVLGPLRLLTIQPHWP